MNVDFSTARPCTPCVCRAACLDESDAQGTRNASGASHKLSVLSCRECTTRHAQIPRAQGGCQLSRLQGLAPARKARDLVCSSGGSSSDLASEDSKAALATASASSSASRAVDNKVSTSL